MKKKKMETIKYETCCFRKLLLQETLIYYINNICTYTLTTGCKKLN